MVLIEIIPKSKGRNFRPTTATSSIVLDEFGLHSKISRSDISNKQRRYCFIFLTLSLSLQLGKKFITSSPSQGHWVWFWVNVLPRITMSNYNRSAYGVNCWEHRSDQFSTQPLTEKFSRTLLRMLYLCTKQFPVEKLIFTNWNRCHVRWFFGRNSWTVKLEKKVSFQGRRF